VSAKIKKIQVSGKIVWSLPPFADQPLWNAAECRGKIVVAMRGPHPPAPTVDYCTKTYFCQQAGAIGVIFVDHESTLARVPVAQDGPIYNGGPILKMEIPCFLTTWQRAASLQQDAVHTMVLAKQQPLGVPPEWHVGFVVCAPQESKQRMPNEEAAALMQHFFSSRRGERSQENELLTRRLDERRQGHEQSLTGKEWVTGNLLDSINFFKEDQKAQTPRPTSQAVAEEMAAQALETQERAQDLADRVESATHALGAAFHDTFLSSKRGM